MWTNFIVGVRSLEILFGPQGKIKKIKMYTDNQGMKKGDALITFLKAESVISSIVRVSNSQVDR
jgi:RNA recognition motif-containing protein